METAAQENHMSMNTNSMKAAGTLATRSWCRENATIIRYLLQFKELGQTGTRFWEYPFVFKHVMSRPKSKILDIAKYRKPNQRRSN